MRATKLALLAALAKLSAGTYVLKDDYQPSNFFDDFEFFDGADPSNGYVTYLDKASAQKAGLASNENNYVYLAVEHEKKASGRGRESVRLETKKTYKHGLIVADISHMPGGICGTWPAFWATGAKWPDDGELDIIEGVNRQVKNVVALHTTAGCKIVDNKQYSGELVTKDCDVRSPTQPGNQGCLFRAPTSSSYGPAFNDVGGGVYATEWTSNSISVWYFPRYQIPSDINSEHPDPSKWARPIAHFTGCEFDKFFQEQRIIFNTALCGDWAKNTWNEGGCSDKARTCEDYVKNNPQAFVEAYWSINYMKVFQSEQPTEPTATYPDSSPTDLPTGTSTNSYPAYPTDASTCTPPPTQSCVTYTTKTTIAVVLTAPESDKEATLPTPTEPAEYPTKDEYATYKRRQHINEHVAGAHH
ncbi:hypothetical protein AJ78_07856 [Emergomyces pasteurianus Ep9510]|uniref:endo-1,3(4)-beta-glucanase n=1 Tax=Emergomyces pasteurianus Ep9510 TaxID=1447872 RepID=A0A1J9Q606_9EURO|nr:hypothetical protein AJ78_07856 [Emergomyces pasteurianus Ep9510]